MADGWGCPELPVQCYDNVVYYCLITDDDVVEEEWGQATMQCKNNKV